MEANSRVSKINLILIVIAIVSAIMAIIMINLPKLRAQIETVIKGSETIKNSYTEERTNQVDISKNGDGSVIATLADNGTLTISGSGEMKDFSSSESIKDILNSTEIIKVIIENGISNIGKYTFYECSTLTSIKIPEGVTRIGEGAFYNCSSLTSINIPKGVTSIGSVAFDRCFSLTNIEIPDSVTSIGYNIFYQCNSLKEINVDENNKNYMDNEGLLYTKDKTTIIKYPEGKEGTTYTIPEGVTSIEGGAFSGCSSLTSIKILEGVTSIGQKAFEGCRSLMNINIPEGVTSIEYSAIASCSNLTSITIPSSVTSIGPYAFYGCSSIASITIPQSVTSIEDDAFYLCSSLTEIKVDEGNMKYMDDNGVLYTKDKTTIIKYPEGKEGITYTILEGVTSIEGYAFYGCSSLTEINIPGGVTSIGERAFNRCRNLLSIAIPSSIESVGRDAFYECEITKLVNKGEEIELPNILQRTQNKEDILYTSKEFSLINCTIEGTKVLINENETFANIKVQDGSLTGLTYTFSYNEWDVSDKGNGSVIGTLSEDGTLTISGTGKMKNWNFSDETDWHNKAIKEKLKNVIINNGVTSIGCDAFYNCSNLTSINIPEGVTRIEEYAFRGCSSLTRIIIPEEVTYIRKEAFYGCSSLKEIKVHEGNTKYMDDEGVLYTKDKTTIIKYPEGKEGTTYTILEGVTSIEGYTFHECSSLQSITIPEGVTSIGYDAFGGCSSLISIDIPSTVTSIGSYAFSRCSRLTSVNIPEGVTSINNYAFHQCSSLTEIKVNENNTKYMDDEGILYTKDKTTIIQYPEGKEGTTYTILEGVTSIEGYAFYECSRLKSITIPEGVTSIGQSAFYSCENLISINLPISIINIGNYAFRDCKNLMELEISSGVTDIGNNAFYGCNKLMIICEIDSIAHNYSKENKINYLAMEYKKVNIYFKGIQPDITYENLMNNIDSNMEYQITEASEVVTGTSLIKTGQKLTINNKTYTLVVTGDINGDGKTNIVDLSRLKLAIVGKLKLEGEYKEASDANSNGQTLQLTDLSKMKLYIVGKTNL